MRVGRIYLNIILITRTLLILLIKFSWSIFQWLLLSVAAVDLLCSGMLLKSLSGRGLKLFLIVLSGVLLRMFLISGGGVLGFGDRPSTLFYFDTKTFLLFLTFEHILECFYSLLIINFRPHVSHSFN